jgi:hypothetical protein
LEAVLEWHGDKTDNADDPAIGHLLQVGGLAIKYRPNDTTVAVAALLHDVLEDVPRVEEAALERRFGSEVAQIVRECSDSIGGRRDSTTWCSRKVEYLTKLPTKSDLARFVSLCDKVANARALELDLAEADTPKEFFSSHRFNETNPSRQLWYYNCLAKMFSQDPPDGAERLATELTRAVAAMTIRLGVEPRPCDGASMDEHPSTEASPGW